MLSHSLGPWWQDIPADYVFAGARTGRERNLVACSNCLGKDGDDATVTAELDEGYAVSGDAQWLPGYSPILTRFASIHVTVGQTSLSASPSTNISMTIALVMSSKMDIRSSAA